MAQRHGRAAAGGSRARTSGQSGFGPRPVDLAALRTRLREVIEPVVEGVGYDLDGLAVSRVGRRHLVRLTVDGDKGVGSDALAEVSRAVSGALDAAEAGGGEIIAGEYQLEVSSPGVDRPLTLPRHWRRNTGRMVQVRAGDKNLTGRVVSADERVVVLDVEGTRHELPLAGLGPGRVQVEFARLAAMSDADLEDTLQKLDDDTEDEEDDSGDEVEEDGQ